MIMNMNMKMCAGAVMEKGLAMLVVLSLLMMPLHSVVYSTSEFGGRKLMSSSHEWREMEEAVASVDYSQDQPRRSVNPPAPKPNTHNQLPLGKSNR